MPERTVIALDSSFGMLRARRTRQSWLRALRCGYVRMSSACRCRTASVDLVVSNFMLPWSDPRLRVFAEFRRVLAPRGSSTSPPWARTPCGNCAAWLQAGHGRADAHTRVIPFIDMHDIGDDWCAPVLPPRCSTWSATRWSTPMCAPGRGSQGDGGAESHRRPAPGAHRSPQICGHAGRV